jgi:hypothetical protein
MYQSTPRALVGEVPHLDNDVLYATTITIFFPPPTASE